MVYSPLWGSHYATIVFKYFSQTVKTLAILFRRKPRAVFVMTPPVIACLPVWLYTKLTGGVYIIDAHSGAFLQKRWRILSFIHKFLSRHALTTIVTNEYLKNIVDGWHGKATIVKDLPIEFPKPKLPQPTSCCAMTFIGSFTWDEPIDVFFEAAAKLPDIQFYMTGNHKDADATLLKAKPANVELTGFLSSADYAGRVIASDAVICLTTLDHTMQRGAYEAVYLGKPVITSNTEILRESFHKGTVFVDNSVSSIVNGIVEMRQQIEKYRVEIQQLKQEKLQIWDRTQLQLHDLLEGHFT
jgi:glycosyltransferase involved in cell wall biosynthesis